MLNLNAKNTVNTIYNFEVLYIVFIFLVFYFWKTLVDVTRNTAHVFWLWDLSSLFWPHFPLSAAEPQERKKKKSKRIIEVCDFSGSLALTRLRHSQGKFTASYFSHIHLRWAGLYLISDCLSRAAMMLCWAFTWRVWSQRLQSWTKLKFASSLVVFTTFSVQNTEHRKNIKVF